MKQKKAMCIIAFVTVAIATTVTYMSNQKKPQLSSLALANIEALANNESQGGTITGECLYSAVIISECHVTCMCGATWYPSPRKPKCTATNVKGRCPRCGNTLWGGYN